VEGDIGIPPAAPEVPAAPESTEASSEITAEVAPAPAPVKPSKQELISQLSELGEDLTHDDLKSISAYNKRVMQTIQGLKADQQREQELSAADGWFTGLTPEQILTLQNNDEFARRSTNGKLDAGGIRRLYDAVQAWKQTGAMQNSGMYERVATDMLDNLKGFFQENPDYPEIGKNWEKIAAEGDGSREGFAKFFAAAVKAEAAGAIRQAKVQMDAEKEAAINEIKAQYLSGQDEPVHAPAGTPAVNGHVTLDYLMSLSSSQRAQYEKDHPAAVEAAYRQGFGLG